ncbi:MAG: hypothetical protein KDD94_09375 [Calditrichaeota bacterium]|nr:hypothetical protein [Calditrichota bacterium]
MKKFGLIFTLFIILLTCDGNLSDNICNPNWFFREEDKDLVDFEEISLNIFDPYCSSCHSTQTYLSNSTSLRDGYLPLDSEMKTLKSDPVFIQLLQYNVNFARPEQSILYQVLVKPDVKTYDGSAYIRSIEPRNNCFLPSDFKKAITWWIENANGNTKALLN